MAFVYLAVILDLYSRRAIGYALSDQIDTDLSLAALRMALQRREPPAGVIHHSDRGVQYAAHEYVNILRAYQFPDQYVPQGEYLTTTLQQKLHENPQDRGVFISGSIRPWLMSKGAFPYFIEDVYNQKRLHASLGYRPPAEFEAMFEPQSLHRPCLMTLS